MARNHFKKLNSMTSFPENFEPSYEEIQKKAYEIYEEKGGGNPVENWLEAERLCKLRQSVYNPLYSDKNPSPAEQKVEESQK